tara:strand:+ start:552 stop:1349 length:798 start_codon:yes stop_codon:yes gene_type:complete
MNQTKKKTTIPTKCVIDGDWLAYTAACYADNEGYDYLEDRIEYDLKDLSSNFETTYIAFSCNRQDNFRKAFWPLYKDNRNNKPKPVFLGDACAYATASDSVEKSIALDRLEADDIISMLVSTGLWTSIGIDKDFRTISGWHWNPRKEDGPVFVEKEEAKFNELTQLVSGDSADNIWGIFGRGPAWAKKVLESSLPLDRKIAEIRQENRDSWNNIKPKYEEKKKKAVEAGFDDPDDYLDSQFIALHLLRPEEYDKETKAITHKMPW